MNDEKKKRSFSLRHIFDHNLFVLIFSFCAAVVAWFLLAAASDMNRPVTIYDVPIQPKLSASAEADGLQVFNMSYSTADIEVAGSSLITGKLTADDFEVTATLNLTSTKLTGNTLQKATVPVRVAKKSAVAEYTISSRSPEEINIEYDRYKEAVFTIENELKYSADAGYYAGTPAFSEEQVTLSGPESSVNKISRAAVSYTVGSPLRSDETISCPVRLYDQNNQEIQDTSGLYLSLSVDTVEVVIPVLAKKTVNVVASTLRQPKGFSGSRISVEPSQIDIVGAAEVLAGISEITLDTPIDFGEIEVGKSNEFTMDIPLPAGVRNISAAGNNTLNQAVVTVLLNGYQQTKVTVPESNIQALNVPAGMVASVVSKRLEVTVNGSAAQILKLTGDSLSVQADLNNYNEQKGVLEVPVTVSISGMGTDSCWVVGKYTVSMTISEPEIVQDQSKGASSDPVAAAPQE